MEEVLRRSPATHKEKSRSYTISDLENEYRRAVLREGDTILKNAGVQEPMQQSLEILRKEFPDAKIEKATLSNDGLVITSVDWNRRIVQDLPADHGRPYEYNSILVIARPVANDLIVAGRNIELIYRGFPDVDPRRLEDAFARAFRDPAIVRRG
jgi:hypothetical protein